MTLEARLNRIEVAQQGGRRVCSRCGRLPNGAFPPNTPEHLRSRNVRDDDGTPMLKCTRCGALLLFQFHVPLGMKLPRIDPSNCTSPNGVFHFNFAAAPPFDENEP